jgi:ERCC4-related helicase
MALAVERRGKPTADAAGLEIDAFRLRSYQTEMVEQSMNENVIVAMDTGSGKTHMCALLII